MDYSESEVIYEDRYNDADKELDWFTNSALNWQKKARTRHGYWEIPSAIVYKPTEMLLDPTARACVTFRSSVSICSTPRVKFGLLRTD